MKRLAGLVAVAATAAVAAVATRAGHEMPVYPSYYPQEIRIEPMAPEAAGVALVKNRIQAYVGAMPPPGVDAKTIAAVESLASFVIVRVNSGSAAAGDDTARCALAGKAVAAIAGNAPGFKFHPYPVNPFHADYFHHFDLAREAAVRFRDQTGGKGLRVAAEGRLAEALVRRLGPPSAAAWDVRVEEVDLGRLLHPYRLTGNGWDGPPWLKEGWFQAYRLLADGLADEAAKRRAADAVRRLQRGDYATAAEKINLERNLVGLLTGQCRRVVAGYGIRREYYSAEYSGGVENVAFDSQDGLNSAIFIRTVKLKDFPWNGWLTLGVDGAPEAAWNPVAGFTDAAGRLIWHALGDPAFFPEPYNAGWSMNRIGDVKKAAGR